MKQFAGSNRGLAGAVLIAALVVAAPLALAHDGGSSGSGGHGGPGPGGMGAIAGHGPGSGMAAGAGAAARGRDGMGHDGMGHDMHDAAGHDTHDMDHMMGDNMRRRHDAHDVDAAGHEAKDVNDVDRPKAAAAAKKGS